MYLKSAYLFLFVSLALIYSCQVDELIIKDDEGQSLDNMSPLADLVARTTLHDGSIDNIIDNSSCISVVLPVAVVANGVELTIATSEDYKLIERIFDESATDTDTLEISFPILVIMADHSEVEVNSYEDLDKLDDDCLEGGIDDDIECIDFRYPISISVYNSISQVTDVITIDNDKELNSFIDDLDEGLIISLNYPIYVVLSDSTEIEINNNDQLESLIEEVEDSCDEDDDNDYNDDDIDTSGLKNTMLSTAWTVTYFYDDEDLSTSFDRLIFSFEDNEEVFVGTNGTVIEGEWDTFGDDGTLEVEFDFESIYPLELLDDDWYVIRYDSLTIELSESEDNTVSIIFEATDQVIEPIFTIADYIIEGEWQIASYKEAGTDESSNYIGYKLNFSADLTLKFFDDTTEFEGEWEEVRNPEEHIFVLDFGSDVEQFKKLNEDWDVVSFTEDRIELIINDSSPETTDNLILEKII